MKDLNEVLQSHTSKQHPIQPVFFDFSLEADRDAAEVLFTNSQIQHVTDDYEEELLELFGIKNPQLVYTPDFKSLFQTHFAELQKTTPLWQQGTWVFYPWRSLLAHILPEEDYYLVRTARNRNLINSEEQEKFYNATIGIGGLSVGSSIAYALTLQGGPKHIKLADMDRLALSNTNRVLAGNESLGLLKVEMAARRIYEVNPYAEVEIFPEGLTHNTIEKFFEGLDIVVDELDNIAVKFLIREHAKKNKIAVVMGADNGDNAVIDVERYDLDPEIPFFHGRLGDVTYDELSNLDKFGIGKTITKHIGPENITIRMQESLVEMGKTIVSWPQLGGAALVNGASVAYCVRRILNGQPIISNRALVSLDEKLDPEFQTPEAEAVRAEASKKFAAGFGL